MDLSRQQCLARYESGLSVDQEMVPSLIEGRISNNTRRMLQAFSLPVSKVSNHATVKFADSTRLNSEIRCPGRRMYLVLLEVACKLGWLANTPSKCAGE